MAQGAMDALYAGYSQAPLAPTPTMTFKASNILGTVSPQVGDNTGSQNYAGVVGGVNPYMVVGVVVALIVLGYMGFHITFGKSGVSL